MTCLKIQIPFTPPNWNEYINRERSNYHSASTLKGEDRWLKDVTTHYVAEIEAEYQKAVKMPHIHKPLAKALYEVWKKHDREDAERRTDG